MNIQLLFLQYSRHELFIFCFEYEAFYIQEKSLYIQRLDQLRMYSLNATRVTQTLMNAAQRAGSGEITE